jgi:hypothetical protein
MSFKHGRDPIYYSANKKRKSRPASYNGQRTSLATYTMAMHTTGQRSIPSVVREDDKKVARVNENTLSLKVCH